MQKALCLVLLRKLPLGGSKFRCWFARVACTLLRKNEECDLRAEYSLLVRQRYSGAGCFFREDVTVAKMHVNHQIVNRVERCHDWGERLKHYVDGDVSTGYYYNWVWV